MAITTPVYCGREAVKRALDMKESARANGQVDRAIEATARDIDGAMHRVFYPTTATRYKDWPGSQRSYPWKLYLDRDELAGAPTLVTAGGTDITSSVFAEPVNQGPPYTRLEINRSTSATFAQGSTPQRAVAITGSFGYDLNTDPAGTLAAAMTDTVGTSAAVSDASLVDAGHILLIDSERMIVADRTMTQAGTLTLSGTGCTTAGLADNTLAVSGSGSLHVDEVILIDAERMLVVDISGSNYIVKRQWDGTTLATHSAGATVSAPRLLTVSRGALGSTAATHNNAAAVSKYRPPKLIHELNIALAINQVLQEQSGYARTVGEGDSLRMAGGAGLSDLWARAKRAHGRKARQRVV